MNKYVLYKIIHWLLLVTALLFLFSGFGISYFRVVETITFGIFTKTVAFKVHEFTWIPFVVLLITHVVMTMRLKRKK